MTQAPYITCRELIEFLHLYLDGELPPERMVEFERHLSVCESCVHYLATYR
jgi:anti-sigma factor RsiW